MFELILPYVAQYEKSQGSRTRAYVRVRFFVDAPDSETCAQEIAFISL